MDGEVVAVELLGRQIDYKAFSRLVSLICFLTGLALTTILLFIPFYYGFSNFEYYAGAASVINFLVLPIFHHKIKSRFKPLSFTDEQKLNRQQQMPA